MYSASNDLVAPRMFLNLIASALRVLPPVQCKINLKAHCTPTSIRFGIHFETVDVSNMPLGDCSPNDFLFPEHMPEPLPFLATVLHGHYRSHGYCLSNPSATFRLSEDEY